MLRRLTEENRTERNLYLGFTSINVCGNLTMGYRVLGDDGRMNNVTTVEQWEAWGRRIATLGVVLVTGMALLGVGNAISRPKGRVVGRGYERLPFVLYVLVAIAEVAAVVRLWRPISLHLSRPMRVVAILVGGLLYAAGLGLIIGGRLALGEMYNVSSSFGAELYVDHRLVTSGPFAMVRHPMYVGAVLGVLGGLLLYRTWTLVLILAHLPIFVFRARREEEALAAEFGEQWRTYARQVPPGLPFVDG